jgi:4-hydroxybenzoate polyprenyltransferase
MGRYVFLLIAPVIVGVLIAAGVVVINGLRQRRIDARRPQFEARRPDPSSELTRRRIAS